MSRHIITCAHEDSFARDIMESGRPVLAVFLADWNMYSHAQRRVVEQYAAQDPHGVRIAVVDAGSNPGLMARCGLDSVPSLAFVRGGHIMMRKTGFTSRYMLDRFVEDSLACPVWRPAIRPPRGPRGPG